MFRHPIQFLQSWYVFFYQFPYLPEFVYRIDDFQFLADIFQGRGNYMEIKNKKSCLTDEELEVYENAVYRNMRFPLNYYRACKLDIS